MGRQVPASHPIDLPWEKKACISENGWCGKEGWICILCANYSFQGSSDRESHPHPPTPILSRFHECKLSLSSHETVGWWWWLHLIEFYWGKKYCILENWRWGRTYPPHWKSSDLSPPPTSIRMLHSCNSRFTICLNSFTLGNKKSLLIMKSPDCLPLTYEDIFATRTLMARNISIQLATFLGAIKTRDLHETLKRNKAFFRVTKIS